MEPAKIFDPPQHPQGLILMLHGCTQNADDFAAGTQMHQVAQSAQLLVAYAEQPPQANPKKCWNWFQSAQQTPGGEEVSRLAQITSELIQRWQIPNERVFLAGLSAGGAMACLLAHHRPDLFRALAVHSGIAAGLAGNLISGLAVMRGLRIGKKKPLGLALPTIVFQGGQDKVVHPKNAQDIVESVQDKSTSRVEEQPDVRRAIYLDPHGRPRVESWLVHGLGHAWSGGCALGSYTAPGGPEASQEMVRFFLSQSNNDTQACLP